MSDVYWGGSLYGSEIPERGQQERREIAGECSRCGARIVAVSVDDLDRLLTSHAVSHLAVDGLSDLARDLTREIPPSGVPVELVRGPDGVYRPAEAAARALVKRGKR